MQAYTISMVDLINGALGNWLDSGADYFSDDENAVFENMEEGLEMVIKINPVTENVTFYFEEEKSL